MLYVEIQILTLYGFDSIQYSLKGNEWSRHADDCPYLAIRWPVFVLMI